MNQLISNHKAVQNLSSLMNALSSMLITSLKTSFNLFVRYFEVTFYRLPMRLMGLKSLREDALSFLGMRVTKRRVHTFWEKAISIEIVNHVANVRSTYIPTFLNKGKI